ncbi:MAG: hypothetical protein ACRDR6_04705 [Pseudonocardiaceae bacterium]
MSAPHGFHPLIADAGLTESLPEGVFHLLIADDDLVHRAFRMRVTVCGELVQPSSLPPSCFEEGGEGGRDPRYCPECVSEAVRWSAEATR